MTIREDISAVAASFKGVIDKDTLDRLALFVELFQRWNERINLGGAISPDVLVHTHFSDSFAAASLVPPLGQVVDVGAGGGLPALPLAMLRPSARYEVYEPTAKKVAFLRTAVRECGLQKVVSVVNRRVDSPPDAEVAGRFDLALSRATFPPSEWLNLGRSLIHAGGKVLVFGTREDAVGGERPLRVVSYGVNRRLLVFGRD